MIKETNKVLPFLDALVKNEGRAFTTSVYRKKASVGLFTQYNDFTPFSYKVGLIMCLIHRAFKISSSYVTFHNKINLKKNKNILQKHVSYLCSVNEIINFLKIQYTTKSNEKT